MCLNPITIKNPANPRRGMVVPCGVCLECKKRYQNNWMIRLECALKYDYNYEAVFFTLTYADECIPKNFVVGQQIYKSQPDYAYDGKTCFDVVDEETGECIDLFEYKDKLMSFNALRKEQLGEFYKWKKEHVVDEDHIYMFNSVRKKDVQEWNNRCRKAYRKATGKQVKYFITSEYGPRTMRPHYHGIMFGINRADFIKYFKKDWIKHFGREANMNDDTCVICEDINPSKGGIMYVTKYCSKGVFEHPFCSKDFFYWKKERGEVVSHTEYHSKHYERCIEYFDIDEPIVDRPDKLISINLGEGFLEKEEYQKYYEFGKYSIEDVIDYDPILLTDDAVNFLGLNDLECDEEGNLYRTHFKDYHVNNEYKLDDLVSFNGNVEVEVSKSIVNQYLKINGKFYSKGYRFIEEHLLDNNRGDFHCWDGTFYSDAVYQYLKGITNKLKINRSYVDKRTNKSKMAAYAMPKYYREKMFSLEVQHLLSCVVSEGNEEVYREQYANISAQNPDWTDLEIEMFIETSTETEKLQRKRELEKKTVKFYEKSEL